MSRDIFLDAHAKFVPARYFEVVKSGPPSRQLFFLGGGLLDVTFGKVVGQSCQATISKQG